MIIFFGTRSAQIESKKLVGHTQCPDCGSENSFVYTIYGNYFHIFWIPMFRFGKTTVVECLHCKKTYDQKELPQNIKITLQKNLQQSPPKKAYWHCAGCFVILALIGLFFLMVLYALILKLTSNDEKIEEKTYNYEKVEEKTITTYEENIPLEWDYQLRKDMRLTDYSPDIEDDEYSYNLMLCLDSPSLNLATETTGYFSKISKNKILILIEAEGLNEFSENEKNKVYKKINKCLNDMLVGENYERYIGVFDNRIFYMLTTPDGIFKGKGAENKKLKKFYNIEDQ